MLPDSSAYTLVCKYRDHSSDYNIVVNGLLICAETLDKMTSVKETVLCSRAVIDT